jgi:wobble nucleotide-excising tRNase
MINKIIKIKNLGIFSDSDGTSNLPDFKRFNIIYGWNGSGKTTLSQLFAIFETGKSENYPDLEYKIQTTDGDFTQATVYNKRIRVFNRDYISDNFDISSCKARPIYVLGKENKELVEAIKQDEIILRGNPEKINDIGKIKELELKKKELEQKETEKGKCFTDVAKIISTNTSGVSARNYRKNNAEQAFLRLKVKNVLTEKEIKQHSLTLKQIEKPILNELSIVNIVNDINSIILCAKSLLQRTVETTLIERLKENSDISKWVEQGILLHTTKNSSNCEFCNQPLPKKRILELSAYFNDADKKLKDEIDNLFIEIDKLTSSVDKLIALDKANLYDEFQADYLLATENLSKTKIELLKSISSLKNEIEKKKANTSEPIILLTIVDATVFVSVVEVINVEIRKHNDKTKRFTQAKIDSTIMLENHYLSEIFDNINKIDEDIKRIRQEISLLEIGDPKNPDQIGITKIQQRIIDNKNKIATSGPACEEINKQLKTFIGHDELTFEVSEEGYLIKRKGKIAKNLSEGEKTAIAFVYFVIHLKDQDFNVKDGMIVVDDPVCSLDSNTQYQAFAFLKNAVREAAQVIILTHNFDFLRLLLRWLKYRKIKPQSEFYMVKNQINEGNRVAKIDRLDPLLREYESEYQYLFNILQNFNCDGTVASVYHIPNIARKVLEYFLMIMVPNNKNQYEKLEKIEFDENKKSAIYKFTNDQSHITGKDFDPSLVQECQNNVKHLIEMIKEVFPAHHKILIESIETLEK